VGCGLLHDPEIVDHVNEWLGNICLDVGSQLVFGHMWLGLALIVGPRSVELGALLGH
jgi:hypothetical protein